MKALTLLLIGVLVISAAVPAEAGPARLADPSFESPVPVGFQGAPASFGAWSLTDGSGTVTPNATHTAAHGTQFIFLPGTNSTSTDLEQTVTGFVPGVVYRCTYRLCGINSNAAPQQCEIEIALFNMKADTYSYAVPSTTTVVGDEMNPWVTRSFLMEAPATSGVLNINVYRANGTDPFAAFDLFTIRPEPMGRPKLQVKTPRKNRVTTSSGSLALKGKVKGQLPGEFVRIRSGKKTRSIKATKSWGSRVRLRPGMNRITIQAIDVAGTKSKIEKIRAFRS